MGIRARAEDGMNDAAAIKKRLRKSTLSERDTLNIDDRLQWDEAIIERILELPQVVATNGPVAGYWQMRSEVDIRPALAALSKRGLATALPAVVDDELAFRSWTPWEPVVPGGFGTLIPPADREVLNPVLLLVPLAAFDRRGGRIGYGKGYYDRALVRLGAAIPGLVAIGVAYGAQEVEEVPLEPWDRRLDLIVTEKETVAPKPALG
jgi:5-formyltetrahydrofolate cyclo-ligase